MHNEKVCSPQCSVKIPLIGAKNRLVDSKFQFSSLTRQWQYSRVQMTVLTPPTTTDLEFKVKVVTFILRSSSWPSVQSKSRDHYFKIKAMMFIFQVKVVTFISRSRVTCLNILHLISCKLFSLYTAHTFHLATYKNRLWCDFNFLADLYKVNFQVLM